MSNVRENEKLLISIFGCLKQIEKPGQSATATTDKRDCDVIKSLSFARPSPYQAFLKVCLFFSPSTSNRTNKYNFPVHYRSKTAFVNKEISSFTGHGVDRYTPI